jgi:hypothetical protein
MPGSDPVDLMGDRRVERARWIGRAGLGEPLHEGERGLGDLAPAVVDRERVADSPTSRAIAAFAQPSRWKSRWTSAQSST